MPSNTPKAQRIIRSLTMGEINLAKAVFKDQIDYEQVKIHRGAYLRFGLQKNQMAMAPNGQIYFPGTSYQADFSKCNHAQKAWFIHEMTHVWQYQQGTSVILKGIGLALMGGYTRKRRAYIYYLPKHLHKQLSEFNIEQQACIVADFFSLHHLKQPMAQAQADFVTRLVTGVFGSES